MTDLASDLGRLSPRQRLDLIEWLWDSLDDEHVPVTAAQCDELEHRVASFDEDRDSGITWQELRSVLRKRQ
ncbi:MAG: addiction module protein [Stellaceae bacterium]